MPRNKIHVESYCRAHRGYGKIDAWRHTIGTDESEVATTNRHYKPKNTIEKVKNTDLFDKKAMWDSKLTMRENNANIKSMASFKNIKF